jgi:hypothetical protein
MGRDHIAIRDVRVTVGILGPGFAHDDAVLLAPELRIATPAFQAAWESATIPIAHALKKPVVAHWFGVRADGPICSPVCGGPLDREHGNTRIQPCLPCPTILPVFAKLLILFWR